MTTATVRRSCDDDDHTAGDVLAIVHGLEGSFQGDLILPGVSLYDAPRRVWNVAALRVGRVREVDIVTCGWRPAWPAHVADGAMTTGQLSVLGSPPESHEALDVDRAR